MSERDRAVPVWASWLLNAVYAVFFLILALQVMRPAGWALDEVYLNSIVAIGVLVSIVAARTARNPRTAKPWWWLAVGFVFQLLCGGAYIASGAADPATAMVDYDQGLVLIASLLRGGFSIALLLALLTSGNLPLERRAQGRLALDAATIFGAGLMATWYFLLTPVAQAYRSASGVLILGFATVSITDLAVLLAVCAVLLRGTSPSGRRPLVLVFTGSITLFASDLVTTVSALHPDLVPGERLHDLLTSVPLMLIVAAAVEQCRHRLSGRPDGAMTRPWRPAAWLPYVALVGGFALLVVAAVRAGLYPWVGLVAGGVLMTASIAARQLLVLIDNRSMATTDPLTGLANRNRLRELLDEAARYSRRTGRQVAVLVIDLDDFKPVNDTLGHQAGDAVLVTFAALLRDTLRSTDAAARLGGDEFAVVLRSISRPQDAVDIAVRILAELETPFEVLGHQVKIGASIGVAVSTPGSTIPDLIREADAAMYDAKRKKGTGWELFVPGGPDRRQEDVQLRDELVAAVTGGQLVVMYQPIVALLTGEIIGVEALVRWQHPTRGLLMPDTFLPFAEQSGQIQEVDSWVLEQACRQVKAWQAGLAPGRGLRLNANLSARWLNRTGLTAEVLDTLAETGLDPHDLVLEITETAALEVGAAIGHLTVLRERGVRIALDDFGTGYSSLAHLLQMPVDVIKLDRCFVAELGTDTATTAIAETVVRLGALLHLDTVAEGIETMEQAERIFRLGYSTAQGYLYARPLPAEELARMLAGPPFPVFAPVEAPVR